MVPRHALVIGAGLAGAAVCERLCIHGWDVTLIDRHAGPAMEASGNHAGSFHPLIARDANRLARLSQAGVTYSLNAWRDLEASGARFGWHEAGALQLSRADGKADPAAALAHMGEVVVGAALADASVAHPALRRVSRDDASAIAGIAVADGGVFFQEGGWVQPAQLVAAQLQRCAVLRGAAFQTRFGCGVAEIRRSEPAPGAAPSTQQGATASYDTQAPLWEVMDAAGLVIARGSVVVVAGGASADVARWFGQTCWPVEGVRGRLTVVEASALKAPQVPVHRDGYVLPAIAGQVVAGASYERDGRLDAAAADRDNLRRLAQLLPGTDPERLQAGPLSRSATRAVARDRLPVIGALPDCAALTHAMVTRNGVRVSDLPRLPGAYVAGAYASRGLTWAALGAHLLACAIEGDPASLDQPLIDAVDPARFVFRALRRAGA